MGAITESVGQGLSDPADVALTLNYAEDVLSEYSPNTSSTYVSGGFDSLGNAYTTRPIAITDVTVRVGRSGSNTANIAIKPTFKTSLSGKTFSRVNSTSTLFTGLLSPGQDASLSTESTYAYPLFTSDYAYYGFRGTGGTGPMEYGRGGSGYVVSVYTLIQTTLSSSQRISGSITQASIPSAPGSFSFSSPATDTTIYLQWNPPADDGMQSPAAYSASNIKGYRINYRNDPEENWKVLVANTGSNATNATVTGLSPSTYYELQFAALNAVTDAHNTSYSSITAHVGSRGPAQSFNTAASTHDIRIWTGTEFKKGIVKVWSGDSWLQYPNISIKTWNGTAFKTATLDS
jgi:hypothetical protein